MKEAVLKVLPAVLGIALGAVVSLLDPHATIILLVVFAAGFVSRLAYGRLAPSLVFSAGVGLGIVSLFMQLLGGFLGGSGGYIVALGLGCLVAVPSAIVSGIGAGIAHLYAGGGQDREQA